MDTNQMEGMARQAGGRVKDAAGALAGNSEMQAEGKASEWMGMAQQRYGEARETIESFAEDKPWAMIGIVAGAAFLLGLIIGRR